MSDKIASMGSISPQASAVWLKIVALSLVFVVAFASRLFSVIRFESVIHEFDPWFNYRATRYLVDHGFYKFLNWFDETSWYPLGRVVGGTVYPGIMVTAAVIHRLLAMVHFHVDIRNVCVFLAPLFSGFTAIATYWFTTELKDPAAGLLAAIFMGIAPGYISRSVAGSYDNEGIAIFLLMITFFCWLKAVKLGSGAWAGVTALFYFYMVSAWGGYAFIINMVPLHVLTLMVMGRYTNRLYVAYSTFYVLGTLLSMQIPFVGFQPTRTAEHMGALGVFGLCQLYSGFLFVRAHIPPQERDTLLKWWPVLLMLLVAPLWLTSLSGKVAPWTGRFYSLWDTGYAKIHIPIIASVSEHQPTAWPSYFFDLNVLIYAFPAGLFFAFRKAKDEHIFLIIYAVFATYFSGVMVRLMLTLTPCVCVAAALVLSEMLDAFLRNVKGFSRLIDSSTTSTTSTHKKDEGFPTELEDTKRPNSAMRATSDTKEIPLASKMDGQSLALTWAVLLVLFYTMCQFVWHCTWVTSSAYSSPSIVLASRNHDGSQLIIDDFREAYYWLRKNTPADTKIMSWWDYGYQIAGMADRYTLVDNNTWNNTHIATVGKGMSTNEEVSYEVMRQHDVDYVLVIFGGVLGYSGDDINKFLWMIRIGQGIYPDDIKESDFFSPQGEYRVDDQASKSMRESVMYKTSYYRIKDLYGGGTAHDRVRNAVIPDKDIKLDALEEAYSTEHYIVRLYKVKKEDHLGRSMAGMSTFERGRRRRT